mmetsp:Transcript_23031/g.75067  ORF Transcript_23031/g.75067 Transcript_23031/m.75067 type:complete len:199 (-) Transcript_23031:1064-1660(-)
MGREAPHGERQGCHRGGGARPHLRRHALGPRPGQNHPGRNQESHRKETRRARRLRRLANQPQRLIGTFDFLLIIECTFAFRSFHFFLPNPRGLEVSFLALFAPSASILARRASIARRSVRFFSRRKRTASRISAPSAASPVAAKSASSSSMEVAKRPSTSAPIPSAVESTARSLATGSASSALSESRLRERRSDGDAA